MNKKIILALISIMLIVSMTNVKGAEGIEITSGDKRVIIGDSREIPLTLKNNGDEDYSRADVLIWKLMKEVNGSLKRIGKGKIKDDKTVNGIRVDMEDNRYEEMNIDDKETKQLRITANETAPAGNYTLEFVVYGMRKGSIDYHYPRLGLEISDDPFELNNGELRVVGRGGKEAYPGDTVSADLKITNHYSESSEINVKLGFYGKETKIYNFNKTVPSGTNVIPVKVESPEIENGEYEVNASFTGNIVKDKEKWGGSQITFSNGINLETFSISNNIAEKWEQNNAIFSLTNYRNQEANIDLKIISNEGQIEITKPVELSTGSSTIKIKLNGTDPGQYDIKGEVIENSNLIASKNKELTILEPIKVNKPEISIKNNQEDSEREIEVNTSANNPREENITASVGISITKSNETNPTYNPSMESVELEPGKNNFTYTKALPKGNYTVKSKLNYKDHTLTNSTELQLELMDTNPNENNNQTNPGITGNGFPWIYLIIPLIAIIVAIYLIMNKEPEEGPERKSPLRKDWTNKTWKTEK